jgi:hypothetical protein
MGRTIVMNLFLITYLIAGTAVALWFLVYALPKSDANAAGTGWAFRMMVFPCCVLLWPILIFIFRGSTEPGRLRGEWRHADLRARRRHARIWTVLPVALLILVTLALLLRTPINIRP